ncbi:Co2+/Mg2+ efflux protein ApaG [Photobacterium halotolerans]|uniref:Co2+/Mg2+ efflux protein ApaG n=1 Tax=Photobacterium halotolerans TaxID=265726 RepID=A0A7X4WB25_9GAMM|nr:Co2+/Mg2+ efflux protein ApaG [Photobacterium halotolerans]NAW65473.1 Co2+/Mg2+ efflux protein ApaG [Photobacterium halotolerans]NAW87856.1 Co2+/Mg2+ efflux protein ApaG [Photobacterium halotolerans]NAX48196.1 Co2+/Mg2+ efflux protein ApaG [Photobacterium halotolerans]
MNNKVIPTIKCRVITHYIDDQSEPEQNRYVFSYTITICNLGQGNAQLLRRRWLITDANGKKLVVEGEGVVGEQPTIAPNDEYTYTSGTIIETPLGVMEGHYVMVDDHGNEFNADIVPFRLAIPNILH